MSGARTRPKLMALLVLVGGAAIAAAVVFSPAIAQPPAPAEAPVVGEEERERPGLLADPERRRELLERIRQRRREMGERGPDMMARMGMMRQAAAPPAIAVADGAVFVVKGNFLYKFDAEDLRLLAKAELEEAPPRPMGRRGFPERAPE